MGDDGDFDFRSYEPFYVVHGSNIEEPFQSLGKLICKRLAGFSEINIGLKRSVVEIKFGIRCEGSDCNFVLRSVINIREIQPCGCTRFAYCKWVKLILLSNPRFV